MSTPPLPPPFIPAPKQITLKNKVLPPLVPSAPVIETPDTAEVEITHSTPTSAEMIEQSKVEGQARIEALIAESEMLQQEIIALFKSKTILTKHTKEKLEQKFINYADINLALINETMNIVSDDLGNYEKLETLDRIRDLDAHYTKRQQELNALRMEQARETLSHTANISNLQKEVEELQHKKDSLAE